VAVAPREELHLHYILLIIAPQQKVDMVKGSILQKLSEISVVSSRATGAQIQTEMR
jgi:hypothetical protein